MADIIKLDEHRENPHMAGEAICLKCYHIWTASVKIGTSMFLCPACKTHMGVMKYQIERDTPHKVCLCGCELFKQDIYGYYCPNCGDYQDY